MSTSYDWSPEQRENLKKTLLELQEKLNGERFATSREPEEVLGHLRFAITGISNRRTGGTDKHNKRKLLAVTGPRNAIIEKLLHAFTDIQISEMQYSDYHPETGVVQRYGIVVSGIDLARSMRKWLEIRGDKPGNLFYSVYLFANGDWRVREEFDAAGIAKLRQRLISR